MIELLPENGYENQIEEQMLPELLSQCRQRFVEPDEGRQIYLARYGAPKRGGSEAVRVLLLLHGFTEGAEKYTETVYYFRSLGYTVYVMEHCGHGRSYRLTDDPSLVDVDDWRRYISDLLFVVKLMREESRCEQITVFGHSMGGAIALAAAAGKPQWFDRLILSSPMLRALPKDRDWRIAQAAARALCLAGKGRSYLPGQHPYQPNESFDEGHATSEARFHYANRLKEEKSYLQLSAGSVRWFRQTAGLWNFIRKRAVTRVTAKVLILQAGRDSLVSNDRQQEWLEAYQRAGGPGAEASRLVNLPDAKHEIYLSEQETLAKYWQEIEDFLTTAK